MRPFVRRVILDSKARTRKYYVDAVSLMGDTKRVEAKAKRIRNFVRSNGRSPYEDWFSRIRDMSVKARTLTRIDRLRFGNFGDCKSVGSGVFELRLQFGPGYRV